MSINRITVLSSALQDPETGWSMGSFCALAEFHQDEGETVQVDRPSDLTRATVRGAIRLDAETLGACRPIAYEQLSKSRDRWGQGLALCLPAHMAVMARRAVITPLGPDADAIRADDRGAALYDMGLGLIQCDFLVRTREAALIAVLDDCAGRSIFEPGNPAMSAILRAHPNRVAATPLGRIEVFQKIGGPDTGGVSPPGPHTHVLPKLMKAGKTHAGNITVPKALVPCAYMHPGNPLIDGFGQPRPYDAGLAGDFAALHAAFAPEELRLVKYTVASAIGAGLGPNDFEEPTTRAGRITLRVTLRQLAQETAVANDRAISATLDAWRRRFDASGDTFDDEPDEQAEHRPVAPANARLH